jgi:hypothetical protein
MVDLEESVANVIKAEVGVAATETAHFETAVDDRTVNMLRLLGELTDLSDADALRVLREAFPDTTLAERVRALRSSRH